MTPIVKSVNLSPTHTFSKTSVGSIMLLKGLGVEGDAHCGIKMKHRSRLKLNPVPPNLRQVHLIHSELFAELLGKGFEISAGLIGENITTFGIDLLDLPRGTRLHLGRSAVVEITGLRNPFNQLNEMKEGLLSAVLDTDVNGNLIRKAGVMGVVVEGGEVSPNDKIRVELPEKPYVKLEKV